MTNMDPRLVSSKAASTEPAPEEVVVPAPVDPEPTPSKPIISSGKLYDFLHFVALILLPAVAALYTAIDALLPNGLPVTVSVVGIIVAVDTFLGALVGVSKAQYNNSEAKYAGEIQTVVSDGKKIYQLVLNSDPDLLDQAKQVIFKIKSL